MLKAKLRTDKLPVVILSTADLDAPIWTNKQHIAARLVAEREVHYIESMGLRAPRLSFTDLKRILARAFTIASGNRSSEKSFKNFHGVETSGIVRYAPAVIPFHSSKAVRAINRWIIERQIVSRLPKEYALWTFSPLTYGLEDAAAVLVYHSVDLLHAIDGIPGETLLAAEKELISRADAVVASSKGVIDHLRVQGADPKLWENVADISLFQQMQAPSEERERRAIFVGNLTPGKVDFDILEQIVAKGMRLALAGPYSIDGTSKDQALDRLLASPLVEYLGTLNQKELAVELGKSWIGIIPYQVNGYTAGVFPMKVYEYLGAGLPVVATALPSFADINIAGMTVVQKESFVDEVARHYQAEYTNPGGDLSSNSWESRLVQIRQLLNAELKSSE